MNQRIRELADEAGLQPYYDAQQDQIEKFAELIVKECINRVHFCIKNDIDFIAEDIERYFGGEE